MPQVPRYSAPTVQETARPNVQQTGNASLESFGGGESAARVAAGVAGIGDVINKIGVQEKAKADELAVLDADRKLSALETDLQYNPQTGALNKKGKDVLQLPDQIKKSWDDGLIPISKDLHNDTQRMAFRKTMESRWASLNGNIQSHMAKELQNFDTQATDSLIQNEREAAGLNYMDPDRIEQSLDRQTDAISKHAARNGLPDEWTQSKVAEARSKTQSSVINRMLANNQDLDASKWYADHRDDFSAGDATSIEKALKEGSLRGQGQRTTDKLMGSFGSWSERLAESKKIENPELRDEVDRRLKTNMAEESAVQNQAQEQATSDATNIIEKTKDFDQVPPALVQQMPLSVRNGLRNYADALREGKKPNTNWTTYYDLKTMASADATRGGFLKENLLAYRPELGDSEFKELVTLQTSMRNGDDKEMDGYRTKSMIVNDSLAAAGIDPTPKPGKKDAEQVALFRRTVDAQIETYQTQTGRKANNDDVQKITDNLIIKGDVPGTGFFGLFKTKKRAFELEEGQALKVDYEKIPRSERLAIEAALNRKGIPPTADKVVETYGRKLERMNGR